MAATTPQFQMIGCLGRHGPYTFYKSIKAGDRIFSLSTFMPVKFWPDSVMLSIADIQLLWTDKSESFCSLKLYFLPENTPEGRLKQHGEDEVIALQDKVIIRASDLMSMLVDESDWDWGFKTPSVASTKPLTTFLSKAFVSESLAGTNKQNGCTAETGSSNVVVLNYPRYTRLRAILKRLEGSSDLDNWYSHPLVLAIGGLNIGPNCRILYAKEQFEHPDLEENELICNHMVPKLKGKRGRKKRQRNASRGSLSNESEFSSAGSPGSEGSYKVVDKKPINGVTAQPKFDLDMKPIISQLDTDISRGHCSSTNNFGDSSNHILQILKIENKGGGRYSDTILGSKRSHNRANGLAALDQSSSLSASKIGSECDWDRQGTAQLLGPALTELAQKLEKSNALQILPIRPTSASVVDTCGDMDNHIPKKRKKTELCLNSVSSSANQKTGPYDSRSSMMGPPIDSRNKKTSQDKNQDSKTGKSALVTAHSSSLLTAKSSPAAGSDINWKPLTLTGASPCPFTSHGKIYYDPYDAKRDAFSGCRDAEVLDFSRKKPRQTKPSENREREQRRSNSNHSMGSELLDLSAKPMSHAAKVKLHALGDIPPPNAMNQLGLRLTSEVTLFPSKNLQNYDSSKGGVGQSSYSNSARTSGNSTATNARPKPEIDIKPWNPNSASASGSSRPFAGGNKEHTTGHSVKKQTRGAFDRNDQPSHSQSSSKSGVGSRDTRERKEPEKMNNMPLNNPYLHPYFGKVDPAYLQFLSAQQFFMPPPPPGFMSIPPGAVEQFYKDFLLQSQGIPPSFQHWFPGTGTDRGPKS